MTNAEKFKEVFGYDIDTDAMTICPFKNVETACLDRDVPCRECLDDYWYNKEYQGEPSIPLSVIEDIKYDVEKYFVDNIWAKKDDCSEETNHFKEVLGIIDKAIKECTHERT